MLADSPQSLSELTSKLKSLYSAPSHPQVAQECLRITSLLLKVNSTKISMKDVLYNNLILAWNTKQPHLLWRLISLFKEMVKGSAYPHLLQALHRPEESPIDLFNVRKLSAVAQRAAVLSCRMGSNEHMFHHYLRQGKALNNKLIYAEALIGYYNSLNARPLLNVNALLEDAISLNIVEHMEAILIGYHKVCRKVEVRDGLPRLFNAICTYSLSCGQTNFSVLFASCLIECDLLSSLDAISILNEGDGVKLLIGCIQAVDVLNEETAEEAFLTLEEVVGTTLLQITNLGYLTSQLINAVQRAKNKWTGNPKWRYLARVQMTLILAIRDQFSSYMPSNLQVLASTLWANTSQEENRTTLHLIERSLNVCPANINAWLKLIQATLTHLTANRRSFPCQLMAVLLNYANLARLPLPQLCNKLIAKIKALFPKIPPYFVELAFQLLLPTLPLSMREAQKLCGWCLLLSSCTSGTKANGCLSRILSTCERAFLCEPFQRMLLKGQETYFYPMLVQYAGISKGAASKMDFISFIFWLKRESQWQLQDMIRHEEEEVLGAPVKDYLKSLPRTQPQLLVQIAVKELFLLAEGKGDQLSESAAILFKVRTYLTTITLTLRRKGVQGLSLYDVGCSKGRVIQQVQTLIDLAYKCDLPQQMLNFIRLQCSFIYSLEGSVELVLLQLAKHVFFKRVSSIHVLGHTPAEVSNQPINTFLRIFLQHPIEREDGVLQDKFVKILYLISRDCSVPNCSSLLSCLASHIWTREKSLREDIVRPTQLFLTSTYYFFNGPLLQTLTSVSSLCDSLLTKVLLAQLQHCLRLNLPSRLTSLSRLATSYLLRSGNLLTLPLLFELGQEPFQVLRVVDALKPFGQVREDFKVVERVLGKGRKSVGVKLRGVGEVLSRSLKGKYGKALVQIVLLHLQREFCFKEHLVFQEKRRIYSCWREGDKSELEETNDTQCHSLEDEVSLLLSQMDSLPQVFLHIQSLAAFLTRLVYQDIRLAHILYSYVGDLLDPLFSSPLLDSAQQHLLQSLLVELFLILEEQTYQVKLHQFKCPQFELKAGFLPLKNNIEAYFASNAHFLQAQASMLKVKLNYLHSHLQHSLTMLFPLGSYAYTLSFRQGGLSVERSSLNDLRDYNKSVSTLIASSKETIARRDIPRAEWWNTRNRINRQLAKIISLVSVLESVQEARGNLLLYVAHQFLQFPFQECRESCRFEGCYRVPSLRYLLGQQVRHFDIRRIKYVVNSAGDLPQTESMLNRIKGPLWEGMAGKAPTLPQLADYYAKDVFLYMGHGTGTSHLKEKEVARMEVRCAAMLFGCSSAKMTVKASEMHGAAYNMLLRQCPSLLGCLWDVTDKDVDKVTEALFLRMGSKLTNLSALLQECKGECKLRYLNGSALVVYGLPAYFRSQ